MGDRHPHKEVRIAIEKALARGWTLRRQGHWGRLYCPHAARDGCQIGVSGTPRNPSVHRRQIERLIDLCPHGPADIEEAKGPNDER